MTRRFVVRPRVAGLRAGAVVFAITTVALLFQATHGPTRDRALWFVFAAVSLGSSGTVLTMLARRTAKELVITDKAIILANIAIRFDEVRMVTTDKRLYGYEALTVMSPSQQLTIDKSHLPAAKYEEVVELVKSRTARA